ncbi:MAG: choice-of-anchor D domain-containing protein [Kofleriaceae bacterium]
MNLNLFLLGSALAAGACTTDASTPTGQVDQALLPAGAFMTLDGVFNSMNFLAYDIGTASPPKVMTLRNSGPVDLTLNTFSLTGLHPADFTIDPSTTTCAVGTILTAAVPTCSLGIIFNPTADGARSARLAIGNDAEGTPHSVPLAGIGVVPGAAQPLAGPIDLRHGFPAWYQSSQGDRLQPCIDNGGFCLAPLPNPAAQPLVADVGSNFQGETFYWAAEADASTVRANGEKALLVLALEGAFASGEVPIPGDQIVFVRLRVRIDALTPNRNYTITHPYGVTVMRSDADGLINETQDIGCAGTPCDFSLVTSHTLLTSFPKWDPAFGAPTPAGYLGNPNVAHRITNSPSGNNLFRIQGNNVDPGGPNPNNLVQRLFTVQGQLVP